jgi:histidyl-tRNA synthetase
LSRRIRTLKGFNDLLPGQTEHWRRLERLAHELCARYGLREGRPPCLEATELFVRSVGEQTDIVGKEMFTFETSRGPVSLRPEITASVCRAYIEHGLDRKAMNRLYYIGPAFRRENPQKGRLRQFHQIGAEILGEPAPEADVELIALAMDLVGGARVRRYEILINSIGDEACRPAYRALLVAELRSRAGSLCEDCRRRVDHNPLRVFDCKNEECQRQFESLPASVDHLCEPCRSHFDAVRAGLASLGIEARLDPRLVRGLDYYVRTTFEIRAGGLGAQNAVLGGGRYDGLIDALGGAPTPGLGWAAGMERLLIAAGAEDEPEPPRLDAFVVTLGARARDSALTLVQSLRRAGLAVGWDTGGRGLGGQMKRADRSGARFAVLVGDDEIERGRATLKDLESGEQSEAPLASELLARHIADGLRAADGRDPRERT